MKTWPKLTIAGALVVFFASACQTSDPTASPHDASPDHRLGGYQPWGASGSPGGAVNEVQVNNGSSGFAGATNVTAGSAFVAMKESAGALPTIGVIRWDEGGDGIQARNLANTGNLGVIRETSDDIIVGDSANVANVQGQVKSGGNYTRLIGGSTIETLDSTSHQLGVPTIGLSSQYGVHGGITVTLDTNVTLSSSQYKFTRIAVSSTVTTTGNRNLVLPPPADPAGSDGYWKIISVNLASGVGANVSMTSTSGAVVVNGAGTATTKSAVVWIDHAAGIIRITPDT